MIPLFIASLVALAPDAVACPTVATGTPNGLTYDTAKTSIVHQNGRTTFTVSINPSGESQEFALVMPVPALLQETDIAVLDSSVFEHLEGYTGLLTMADAGCALGGDAAADSDGDGGGGGSGGTAGGTVHVEAEYLVGDYQITILSAEESAGLFTWLNTNGYNLAAPTLPVLEDYIAQGMYFMAAKVSEEATAADGSSLPPLQVAYNSSNISIPIRLAALNASTQQDMLIYAFTDQTEVGGAVGISNYDEFVVEDKCIWGDPAADDFNAFYEDEFNALWEISDKAAWTVEWSGQPYSCSPCSGVTIDESDLAALGFVGEYNNHFLTRIHMRYTPETADQDLMLYASGMSQSKVTSFADDNENNRSCIAVCGEALDVGDGGDGSDGGGTGVDDGGVSPANTSDDGKGSGCSSVSAVPWSLGGLALLALGAVRRRED